VSVRHRGSRHKRLYRHIDFRRDKKDVVATVVSIEYDPNRNSHISLVKYSDGEVRYIVHPEGLRIGDTIVSSDTADIAVGNAMPLSRIPIGTEVHNIEVIPGQGAKMVRSAGSFAVVIAHDGEYSHVKLTSGEVKRFRSQAMATIGRVGNSGHKDEKNIKAGRNIRLGWRPTVRGTAMNPRSHPHGGGEGRSGEGMHPKTPWGKPARGGRTRHPKKWTNKLIISNRPR
jgi:large subunit ribosomal protein L2